MAEIRAHSAQTHGFASCRRTAPVPLLVDFGSASVRDAALFIEQGAQALSIKPGRFGFSDSRAMQKLATQAGCVPVVGLMGESALGTLAGLQFAATIAKPTLPAELTWFLAMIEQVSEWMPKIVGGTIRCRIMYRSASWSIGKRSSNTRPRNIVLKHHGCPRTKGHPWSKWASMVGRWVSTMQVTYHPSGAGEPLRLSSGRSGSWPQTPAVGPHRC